MKRNRSQRKVNMYYMEFQLLEVLSVNNIPQKFAFSNEHWFQKPLYQLHSHLTRIVSNNVTTVWNPSHSLTKPSLARNIHEDFRLNSFVATSYSCPICSFWYPSRPFYIQESILDIVWKYLKRILRRIGSWDGSVDTVPRLTPWVNIEIRSRCKGFPLVHRVKSNVRSSPVMWPMCSAAT